MKWRDRYDDGFHSLAQEQEGWDMNISGWRELWEQILSGFAWSG